MTEREKLTNIVCCAIQNECSGHCDHKPCTTVEIVVDDLIANGVTFQTTPVTYERLLEIARKMHCWIFLDVGDEQKVYDVLGLTDEENAILGYSGQMVISTNDGGLKNG